MSQFKLIFALLLLLTISSVSVFADTSGDLSVISGNTYSIHYEAKDSKVNSVEINKESQSLVFSVTATSSAATLQLTLPRELIDSTKNDGTDDRFIVLADGTPVSENEKSSSSLARILLIPLSRDVTEVEIIGTHLATMASMSQNGAQSTPSQTTSPEKITDQKPLENKSSPQTTAPNMSKSSLTASQTKSIPEQLVQQLTSLLHFKSGYVPLEFSKKQMVEYSIIAAIALIIIIVIASSARSKNKKPDRK